jgi:Zn-dependent peptidase ImmA (M78 family)/transcriptional regulator with XRE-family HTH domain
MFGKNLKYYRLKKNLSMKELADMVGVTNMAISNYESGKRTPDIMILRKLASALGIQVMDFMTIRNQLLHFAHGEFRRNSTLSKGKQEYLYESLEEYFNRFFTVINILGSTVLPPAPEIHHLSLDSDNQVNAGRLRDWLKLSSEGPINSLVTLLENNGILVYLIEFDDSKFSGINGSANEYPYIAINKNMSPERQRFTITHELVHMAFDWPNNISEKESEKIANGIAGAFLFPEKDANRELGIKRSGIQADMQVSAEEFGISMICLAYRARELKIVSEDAYRKFMMTASKLGWRKNEPSRIGQELSNLFMQLVYRAVAEEEINIQRGAELLNVPYEKIYDTLIQFSAEGR